MEEFNEMNITTMTVIMETQGFININGAFSLLPVTSNSKEVGSIISLRYEGCTRGVVKKVKKNQFKNSITIDLVTSSKEVNLKLSLGTIQMCGALSIQHAQESADLILGHLKRIQNVFNSAKNSGKFYSTFNLLMEVDHDTFDFDNCYLEDFKQIDPILFALIKNLCKDFTNKEDRNTELEYLKSIETIIDQDASVVSIRPAMVNYNYGLGFCIDRRKLDDIINNSETEFVSHFHNILEHNVTIELPYDESDMQQVFSRKKRYKPMHTFLAYKSGLITQSGPSIELVKKAYEKFSSFIKPILPHIKSTDGDESVISEESD